MCLLHKDIHRKHILHEGCGLVHGGGGAATPWRLACGSGVVWEAEPGRLHYQDELAVTTFHLVSLNSTFKFLWEKILLAHFRSHACLWANRYPGEWSQAWLARPGSCPYPWTSEGQAHQSHGTRRWGWYSIPSSEQRWVSCEASPQGLNVSQKKELPLAVSVLWAQGLVSRACMDSDTCLSDQLKQISLEWGLDISIFSFFKFFFAMPHCFQDLNSPTSDLICGPCSGSSES